MRTAEIVDDMPDQIDFSNAERGRSAGHIPADATVVILEADVIEVHPDFGTVNTPLRMVLRAGVLATRRESAKKRKAS